MRGIAECLDNRIVTVVSGRFQQTTAYIPSHDMDFFRHAICRPLYKLHGWNLFLHFIQCVSRFCKSNTFAMAGPSKYANFLVYLAVQ
jgi:hypothetical protein